MAEEKVSRIKFAKLALTKSFEIEDKKDNASLTWSTRNGFPRITVFTSDKAFVDNKMDFNYVITAPFGYVELEILLDRLCSIINHDGKISYRIDCYNTKFVNNNRTDETYLQASVIVGKDDQGVIYIAVKQDSKRSIKFDLLPNPKWFKFYDHNNEEITDKKVLSKLYATGYCKILNRLFNISSGQELVSTISTDNPKSKKPAYSQPTTKVEEPKPAETKTEDFGNISGFDDDIF